MNNIQKCQFLFEVQKPARYTGGEYNIIKKKPEEVELFFALAFPDVYDIGMSHLGNKILYHVLNKEKHIAAERVFAPWTDMEEKMRAASMLLYSLETGKNVKEFDVLGFTLQYELSYSNIINMLDLSKVSLLSSERGIDEPIVVGGGPCAFNPEPLADFFDCFALGDGEEIVLEIANTVLQWKKSGKPGGRRQVLQALALIQGVYVPMLYDVAYNEDDSLQSVTPNHRSAPSIVRKRLWAKLDGDAYPWHPIIPFVETVHDRAMVEIFRGCTRGCRFCQAGMIYRPVRERNVEELIARSKECIQSSGYDEIALLSLSSNDYSAIEPLIDGLKSTLEDLKVNISLPSLRVDAMSVQLADKVQKIRKSSMTLAPEAGTQRMRDVINKGVTESDIEEAAISTLKSGCTVIKLYFMIGLPTEEDEDIKGIVDTIARIVMLSKEYAPGKIIKINVSVSSFVPKAHTPFQWYGQNTEEELEKKQKLLWDYAEERFSQILGGRKWRKKINISWSDTYKSFLEAAFARGDRRLSKVLLTAWQNGAKFDGWSEHFKAGVWQKAFLFNDILPAFYANRSLATDEIMPWDHISSGVKKEFLLQEYYDAIKEKKTMDCRWNECSLCGVCNS